MDESNIKDLNIEDKKEKRKTAIVKHSNVLAEIPLQNFTAVETNAFWALLFLAQGKRATSRLYIDFKEFRNLSGYTRRGDRLLLETLKEMSFKFARITLSEESEKGFKIVVPFIDFEGDYDNRRFSVGIHPDFATYLNDLTGEPGRRYVLTDIISIISRVKSVYSKHCLKYLFLYRNTGVWYVTLEQLMYYLDIPAKYKPGDVSRVLEKVESEFREADIFERFEITPRYNDSPLKSMGRKKLTGFIFRFKFDDDLFEGRERAYIDVKEESIVCPRCGGRLVRIERRDGTGWFYGHKGGGRKSADCHFTVSPDKVADGKVVTNDAPLKHEERDSEYVSTGELDRYYRYIREKEALAAAEREKEIEEKEPVIWELQMAYRKQKAELIDKMAVFGFLRDGREEKEKAKAAVDNAGMEVRRALVSKGYDEDYLSVKCRCNECGDYGQRKDGTFCPCRAERIKEAAEWLKGQK